MRGRWAEGCLRRGLRARDGVALEGCIVHEVRFFTPTTPHTMQLQSILRRVQPIPRFVYGHVEWQRDSLRVHVHPRKRSKGLCSNCARRRPTYDTAPARTFAFVPLWGDAGLPLYAMRRVDCPRCGVTRRGGARGPSGKIADDLRAHLVPRAAGRSCCPGRRPPGASARAGTLSSAPSSMPSAGAWSIATSTASAPSASMSCRGRRGTSTSRSSTSSTTDVAGCPDRAHRTASRFNGFFDMLGEERSKAIVFVASDMWKAFLKVVTQRCSTAIHVLDRFHVAQLLSKAIDTVRREEVRSPARRRSSRRADQDALGAAQTPREPRTTRARHACASSCAQPPLVAGVPARRAVPALLDLRLAHLWPEQFLDRWTTMAMRSRLTPFKIFARTLREHRSSCSIGSGTRPFAHGATEGFNNKARITTRKAYGFRTYEHAEIALYHALGDLPGARLAHP